MTPEIQQLQQTIAQGVYEVLPEDGWTDATYSFQAITRFFSETGHYLLNDVKTVSFVAEDEVSDAFRELRTKMAALHENGHAWYTATFTLTPDGNFKFDFIYDELPAFEIIPSPDKWADEFRTYPRPELQDLVPQQPKL
ncbi:antitoxin YezG family protein [Pseudomonas sp. MM211]|uniref:immunity protein YezG family protein n=1 Tax=Pseudomonas sp. MM211 TaxID=2866808 RepID=UPI001CEDF38B|nr:immunity protein YezG family protein [Pseudomonas sp. MM211]UCJ17899.1 antitoxin YezG family protein [Pseudomonas sp. MM211]